MNAVRQFPANGSFSYRHRSLAIASTIAAWTAAQTRAVHTPRMPVQDHSQIPPSFACPNIADVTSPFLIGHISTEVTIQQVWCNVERVIAIPLSSKLHFDCGAMVIPLVCAIRTASWRNSSFRFSPIVSLLWCSKCYQRSGIKPRRVHIRPLDGLAIWMESVMDGNSVGKCPVAHGATSA